MKEGKKEM